MTPEPSTDQNAGGATFCPRNIDLAFGTSRVDERGCTGPRIAGRLIGCAGDGGVLRIGTFWMAMSGGEYTGRERDSQQYLTPYCMRWPAASRSPSTG